MPSDRPEKNRSADMSAIADALDAFVNTSTPGQAMAILKQRVEVLLSDEAVRILALYGKDLLTGTV